MNTMTVLRNEGELETWPINDSAEPRGCRRRTVGSDRPQNEWYHTSLGKKKKRPWIML